MISIIIPTYNRENTIIRSVQSVLDQTYNDIEVIIVDDCSTDNTKRIVTSMNDERIVYFKLSNNMGANYARNKGVYLSKGDYVAFQDSDDYWYRDKLEHQVKLLEENEADIVFCAFERKNDGIKIPSNLNQGKVNVQSILSENIMSTQTIMGKRICFENQEFDVKLPRFQDWELALRLMSIYDVYFLDEVLVEQYIQIDSITKKPEKAIEAIELIMNKHSNLFDENRESLAIMYQNLAAYLILDGKRPYNSLFKALKIHFKISTLLKLLFSFTGLYQCKLKKANKLL